MKNMCGCFYLGFIPQHDWPFNCLIPFQIGVAESRFVKPLVKIFKAGSHLLIDDCPINWNLFVSKSVYQLLHFLKKSRQVKSICNCMMNVHRKRHHQFTVVLLIFTPSYHRGKEFSLIKNVNVEVFISYPRIAIRFYDTKIVGKKAEK